MDQPTKRFLIPPISPAVGKPLYKQVIDGIKREIGAGRLAPHSPLPSFRQLAEELRTSLITVKRAYEELEHEKIIYRHQGLGTFVAANGVDQNRIVRRNRAENLLREALNEGREAGLTGEELTEMLNRLMQEREG